MDLGMIGLGRMGANLVRRLLRDGHRVVVYDVNPEAVASLVTEGAVGADDPHHQVAGLPAPSALWVMVPAAITGRVIDGVAAHLEAGDIVIDGGNGFYQDDQHRAAMLAEKRHQVGRLGTSGGVFGLERGFCLMIGGDREAVTYLDPIFRSLAPGQGDEPMILVLSRGHFCPKDRRQLRNLVDFFPELKVGYTRLVTISTDNLHETNEFRDGVGAQWPFLSDGGGKSRRISTSRNTRTRTTIR